MPKTHISLDLETWGKRPGCDIRSIGACVFDPWAGTVKGSWNWRNEIKHPDYTFYIATENPHKSGMTDEFLSICPGIETIEDRKYPLTRDPETIKWWNDQGEEAKAAFANPVDLFDGLYLFGLWVAGLPHGGDLENLHIWTNGHFDCPILEAAYIACGLAAPWHYRSPRDFRTLVDDAAGMTRDEYCNYGVAHNALDDAIAQAMTLCKAFERLRDR